MANSYESLKYIVTMETASSDEEERQLNGCFRVDYAEAVVTCWLDPAQPEDRDTYRIRKPL